MPPKMNQPESPRSFVSPNHWLLRELPAKKCSICAEEFKPVRTNQLTCSQKCRTISLANRDRGRYGKRGELSAVREYASEPLKDVCALNGPPLADNGSQIQRAKRLDELDGDAEHE